MKKPCNGAVSIAEQDSIDTKFRWQISCTCGEILGEFASFNQYDSEIMDLFKDEQELHRAGVSLNEACGFSDETGRKLSDAENHYVIERIRRYAKKK